MIMGRICACAKCGGPAPASAARALCDRCRREFDPEPVAVDYDGRVKPLAELMTRPEARALQHLIVRG